MSTLCPYHAGVLARSIRYHTHLTRKEHRRMARDIATQCYECAGLPSPVQPHTSRDPEDT